MEQTVNEAFSGIVTNSLSMLEVFNLVEKVSKTKSSVLILGDTGTGKELFARAIWKLSGRNHKQPVFVNCAAIPDHLLESELFGYKKGAFTDAREDKKGKVEEADQGTLVLDEVAELSLSAQSKLLRVVENHELQRLGDVKNTNVDVRVLASTNKNLQDAVENKTFREDLYYRLSEMVIKLPPLRERAEDIPLLVNHFIRVFNEEFNKKVKGISEAALSLLKRHPFPGNVRELKNIVKRAMILVEGEMLWVEHLPIDVHIHADESGELVSFPSLKDVEKEHILKAMLKAEKNKVKAAQLLGISRQTLYEKLKLYGIEG